MLSNLRTYERFIYALPQNYPFIQRSTLVVIPHGATLAELTGTIFFAQDINFTVWEDIDFADEIIHGYSYAVNKGSTRLYWYDPQRLILVIQNLPVHIRTISMYRRISNVTEFQPQD